MTTANTSSAVSRVAVFLLLVVVTCGLATTQACAADHNFNGLVHGIEKQYGVHHTHIPMLGMVLFFAKPHGVHTLKIATFEDFHPQREVFGPEVQRMIEQNFGGEWKPLVRTWSRKGESAFVYVNTTVNTASPKVEMLVVALDTDEATVVELKVDESAMDEWMDEPGKMVRGTTGHHDEEAKKQDGDVGGATK